MIPHATQAEGWFPSLRAHRVHQAGTRPIGGRVVARAVRFRARFADVIAIWWTKMLKQKQLGWFQSFYGQVAIIFPFVVAAPRYFSGAMPLGFIFQVASAFARCRLQKADSAAVHELAVP